MKIQEIKIKSTNVEEKQENTKVEPNYATRSHMDEAYHWKVVT